MSYARVKEEGTVGYSVRKVFRVSGFSGVPLQGPKGYETIRLGPFGHPETPGITWELRLLGYPGHGGTHHPQASVYLVPVEFPEGLELETSYTVVVTEVERAGLCVFSKGHGGAGWDEFSEVEKICFEKTSCGCGCGAETFHFLCCSMGTCAKDKTKTFKGPVKVEVTVEYRYEKPAQDKLPFADWLFSDVLADMYVEYSHSEHLIPAHSIVLAGASPVLKELIQRKGRDFVCSPATLGGEQYEWNEEAVRAMLRFAYTGAVGRLGSLYLTELDDLSHLSQHLKMEELSAACEKQLVTRLTEDFALTALLAHKKGLTAVLRAAEAMVAEKKVGIPKSQWAIVFNKNTDLFASLSGLQLAD